MLKKGILLGFSILLLYLAIFGLRTERIETLRRTVSENVKVGSSSEDVAHFLDADHLEHTNLVRPALMNLYGHKYDNELIIVSSKNHAWQSLLQSERFEIVFVFDDNHKLNRFDLFPVYTGL